MSRELTEAELLERGQEMARIHARYDRVEEEKKETTRTLGEALKGMRKRLQRIAQEVRTGLAFDDDQAELFAHEGGKAEDDDEAETG